MAEAGVQQWVQSDDLKLSVRVWPQPVRVPARPTVILVHGYPDDSSVWDAVAGLLAADYRVVTYDVRGAGQSDAPRRVADYRLEYLVADLAAVIDAVAPGQSIHLVAHDWGSIQSWEAVTTDRLKGRIASFTSISGPSFDHGGYWFQGCFRKGSWLGCRQGLGQLSRSWYMFFFQLPWLAPLGWKLILARAWPRMLHRVEGIRMEPRPQQLRDGVNGINLYRANLLPRLLRPRPRYAHAPVLLIVPTQDPYLSTALYDGIDRWVPQLRRVEVDSGHWLPLKKPEFVAQRVRDFVEDVERS